jgi:hypothetical protein
MSPRVFGVLLYTALGLLYGAIVQRLLSAEQVRRGRALIAGSTVLLATCLYVLADVVSVRVLNCIACYVCHTAVFVLSLAIVWWWKVRTCKAAGLVCPEA